MSALITALIFRVATVVLMVVSVLADDPHDSIRFLVLAVFMTLLAQDMERER